MFLSLSDINATIITSVEGLPTKPALIYYGVGTAAGLRNARGGLDMENYHQFPRMLQDLKNTIPELQIHVVLMDPEQEYPLYMQNDLSLIEITEFCYVSEDSSITVYILRKPVLCSDEQPDCLNITHDLACMNFYAMWNNLTILYHNFTGKSNQTIAELFDGDIMEHHDHILYGFGNRQDLGCYFNLNDMVLPFRLTAPHGGRPMVKFYNIYKYTLLKDYARLRATEEKYPANMHCLIQKQKAQIQSHILEEFRNFSFHHLRVNKDDPETFQNLKKRLSEKIEVLCRLKALPFSGEGLMEQILSEPNIYLWYDRLISALNE
jgi:hypothetical protein